jgi:hypothetical protein
MTTAGFVLLNVIFGGLLFWSGYMIGKRRR